MNVAVFARVSTKDGRQNTERQINDLTEFAAGQKWTVKKIITEEISGAKTNKDRAGLQQLFRLAQDRKIQKVVITEISRLGRKVSEALEIIDRLHDFKVSIYIQNIGIETLLPNGKENFMFKPILLTLIGFAEMERELLRERILSGLETARKNGVKLGRPKGSTLKDAGLLSKYPKVVRKLKEDNMSIREVAKVCEVSTYTVQKVKKVLRDAKN